MPGRCVGGDVTILEKRWFHICRKTLKVGRGQRKGAQGFSKLKPIFLRKYSLPGSITILRKQNLEREKDILLPSFFFFFWPIFYSFSDTFFTSPLSKEKKNRLLLSQIWTKAICKRLWKVGQGLQVAYANNICRILWKVVFLKNKTIKCAYIQTFLLTYVLFLEADFPMMMHV